MHYKNAIEEYFTIKYSDSERHRVIEYIAAEWMSADEQMANFFDTYEEG